MAGTVWVDQANQLRHDRPARKVRKSSRWLLLRNRPNLRLEQSVHLKELLAANQPLLCVYLLRDELKRLCFYQKPAWAQNPKRFKASSTVSTRPSLKPGASQPENLAFPLADRQAVSCPRARNRHG